MNRSRLRTLHRWIFIFMGVFILMWLASGIVMTLPQYWFGAVTRYDQPEVDFRLATVSPAETVARLENPAGEKTAIRKIQLRGLGDRILYQVTLDNNDTRYIDAQTGEPFEFTLELATAIARRNFDIESPLLEQTRLTEHDAYYPFGQLPVYRIRFSDSPGISYFVLENQNRVFRSSMLSRIRGAIVSLHNFGPVDFFSSNPDTRKNLLILTGALSLLGAVAGFILTLPRRRRDSQAESGNH